MKLKKILFTLSFILVNVVSFSQQIGSGFPSSAIYDFNIELPSGFYQGLNPNGKVDPSSHPWNHLLNLRHSNQENNHQLQIASSYAENDRLFFRKFARLNGSNNPDWNEIATRGGNTFNGNQTIQSYSPQLLLKRDTDYGGFTQGVQTQLVDGTNNWFFGNLHADSWIVSKGDYTGQKFTILSNGNVGIGTAAPSSKLHVNGAITLPLPGTTESSEEGISPAVNHRFNYDGKYLNHYGFGFYPFSKSVDAGGINTYMAGYYGLDFFTNDTNRIKILHNGNVGIGTITPDKKLTVNGTIHSSEVIVDTNIAPDYVFEKYYTGVSVLKSDYHFPTLAEIENFTQKNNHLPGVPSAKEMQEKGISLGEISTILLQKIEELTLYTIEQQKDMDKQRQYLIQQNKEIEELKTQVKLLLASKK